MYSLILAKSFLGELFVKAAETARKQLQYGGLLKKGSLFMNYTNPPGNALLIEISISR